MVKHIVGLPKTNLNSVYSVPQKSSTGTFAVSKRDIFNYTPFLFKTKF